MVKDIPLKFEDVHGGGSESSGEKEGLKKRIRPMHTIFAFVHSAA
jgi:hypothetical protein